MACKTYYAYYAIYLCLDDYHAYLSISYVYEIKCVVVPLILCIFTICNTILSHDYTYSFRHHTFSKIVQLSSHMLLSVNLVLINPCIS
jgi:hypothetical protein